VAFLHFSSATRAALFPGADRESEPRRNTLRGEIFPSCLLLPHEIANRRHGSPAITRVKPRDRQRRADGSQPALAKEPCEKKEFVDRVVVVDQPLVRADDFIVQPVPKHPAAGVASERRADTFVIISELRLPVPAGGSDKGFQTPDICIVVDVIPRPIEKDGDPFFHRHGRGCGCIWPWQSVTSRQLMLLSECCLNGIVRSV
jgi:hypothetical protein